MKILANNLKKQYDLFAEEYKNKALQINIMILMIIVQKKIKMKIKKVLLKIKMMNPKKKIIT